MRNFLGLTIIMDRPYNGTMKTNKSMTREEFDKFCKKYAFKPYAKIVKSKDGHADYSDPENWSDHKNWTGIGYVYIWAEEYRSNVTVVYVGKAGKTMKARCSQHLGGFKDGSKKGIKHSKDILTGISDHKTYSLYARLSDKKTIVDEEKISMCDVEEKAFITKLKKLQGPKSLWNKR